MQRIGEQAIYNWRQNQLAQVSIDVTTVQGIDAVIFSRVLVCGPCQSEMVSWQQVLCQKARTTRAFLSIWDLNSGCDPATFVKRSERKNAGISDGFGVMNV